jgi:hypothetical protein
MNSVKNNLPRHERNSNLNFVAPTNVNTYTTHTKSARTGGEGREITPKNREGNRVS